MKDLLYTDKYRVFEIYDQKDNPLWVSDNCGGAYPISHDDTFTLFVELKKYFEEYGYPRQIDG